MSEFISCFMCHVSCCLTLDGGVVLPTGPPVNKKSEHRAAAGVGYKHIGEEEVKAGFEETDETDAVSDLAADDNDSGQGADDTIDSIIGDFGHISPVLSWLKVGEGAGGSRSLSLQELVDHGYICPKFEHSEREVQDDERE